MTTSKPLYPTDDRALAAEVIPHLEAERSRTARAFYFAFAVSMAAVGIVVVVFSASPNDITSIGVAGGIGLVASICSFGAAFSRRNRFAGTFSRWQDERVMKSLDPNCDFDAAAYLESGEYDRSGLFPEEYNGYSGSNLINRRIGDTEVACSNLNVTYTWQTHRTETYTDSQGHTQTRTVTDSHTVTRFSGLLLRFDAPKDFTGRVYIDPERTCSRDVDTTEVLLPSAEFMDRFAVSATDEFTAHYLLSPTAIQRILALQARFREPIHLSYIDGSLFLALPESNLDFGDAPGLFRTITEETVLATVSKCRDCLRFLDDLVEQLDMNTRIWTKQ